MLLSLFLSILSSDNYELAYLEFQTLDSERIPWSEFFLLWVCAGDWLQSLLPDCHLPRRQYRSTEVFWWSCRITRSDSPDIVSQLFCCYWESIFDYSSQFFNSSWIDGKITHWAFPHREVNDRPLRQIMELHKRTLPDIFALYHPQYDSLFQFEVRIPIW